MARTGMSALIADLRQRAEAGTADYTIHATTYWSDDTLQAFLDRNRRDVFREPLTVQPVYDGGTLVYRDYYWKREHVEQADGGTVWRVETSAGALGGTADYTPNYDARHLYFAADQGGTVYYLTYRAYDLDAAEAEVWERKAAHVAALYDVSTDNHDLKRSQLVKHYREMAQAARRRVRPTARMLRRGDING
jgi:outer membrane protein assembly factor BamB